MKRRLSRRMFLGGGAAVAVGLPLLDAMIPARRSARAQNARPVRLVYMYVPYGMVRTNFTPRTLGADYVLPETIAQLAPLRRKFSVLSGIHNPPGEARFVFPDGRESHDGPGDHARDTATFLTCARIRKVEGSGFRASISADQVAANHLRAHTAIPSLTLLGRPLNKGNDSGYARVYTENISWADDTTPMAKTHNARAVFDALFAGFDPGESDAASQQRIADQRSILDACLDDLASLEPQLGAADRRKLDQYLTGIRHIEQQLGSGGAAGGCEAPERGPGDPEHFGENIEHMLELIRLAFQCDRTRVATLHMEPSNYNFVRLGGDVHNKTHFENGPSTDAPRVEAFNRWQVRQFGTLLSKLDSIREDEDGTLLDNSAVLFGSGLDGTGHRDGSTMGDLTPGTASVHRHSNIPLLLGGSARGQLRTGRHFDFGGDRLSNLHMRLLSTVDVHLSRFGADGSEPVAQL